MEEEEEDDGTLKKSADASTQILFIKPRDSANLPAGTVANVIVGFKNNGKADFKVNSMEGSFRYPQDFNYFIQNVNRTEILMHTLYDDSSVLYIVVHYQFNE